MISSSYDFQAREQRSKERCCFFQTAPKWYEVLQDLLLVLPGLLPVLPCLTSLLWCVHKLFRITHLLLVYQSSAISAISVPVIRDPSYCEGWPECPPRVWKSPEIDTFGCRYNVPDRKWPVAWYWYCLGDGIWLIASVSNSSKLPGQFRVIFQPGTEP